MISKFSKFAIVVITCLFTGQASYCQQETCSIKSLIAQLNSGKYVKREAATNALIKIGHKAIIPLKNSLNSEISFEQKKRIEKILSKIQMVHFGYEYVGFANPLRKISGLNPGDIIIKIGNALPVEIPEQKVFKDCEGDFILTIWVSDRNVKQRIKKLRVRIRKGDHVAFLNRVGCTSEYLYTGHRGKWDTLAIESIRASYTGEWDRALELGNKAFEAGCRDASLYHRIMQVSFKLMRFDIMEHFIETYSTNLTGNKIRALSTCAAYPGVLDLINKRYKNAKLKLEKAYKKCKENHIADHAHFLKLNLITLYFEIEPNKIPEFINENYKSKLSQKLHPCFKWFYLSTLDKLASRDILLAKKLLEKTIKTETGHADIFHDNILANLDFKLKLQQDHKKNQKLYPVLTHYDDVVRNVSARKNSPSILNLPTLPTYCKIIADIKIKSARPELASDKKYFSLILNAKKNKEIISTSLNQNFEIDSKIDVEYISGRKHDSLNMNKLAAIKSYNTFSITKLPNKVEISCNNKATKSLLYNHSEIIKPNFYPYIKFRSCNASIKNIRCYAYSKVKVDNNKIYQLLQKMKSSIQVGDLEQYKEHHLKLIKIWSKIPKLRKLIAKYNYRLQIYKKVFSQAGWSPTMKWVYDQHKLRTEHRYKYTISNWMSSNKSEPLRYLQYENCFSDSSKPEFAKIPLVIDLPLPKSLSIISKFDIIALTYKGSAKLPNIYIGFGINSVGNFNSKLISKCGLSFLVRYLNPMIFMWKDNANKFVGKRFKLSPPKISKIPPKTISRQYSLTIKLVSDAKNNCAYYFNNATNPTFEYKYNSKNLGSEIMINPRFPDKETVGKGGVNINSLNFKFNGKIKGQQKS